MYGVRKERKESYLKHFKLASYWNSSKLNQATYNYLILHKLLMLSLEISQRWKLWFFSSLFWTASCPGYMHGFLNSKVYAHYFECPWSPKETLSQPFLPGLQHVYCLTQLQYFAQGGIRLLSCYNIFEECPLYSHFIIFKPLCWGIIDMQKSSHI